MERNEEQDLGRMRVGKHSACLPSKCGPKFYTLAVIGGPMRAGFRGQRSGHQFTGGPALLTFAAYPWLAPSPCHDLSTYLCPDERNQFSSFQPTFSDAQPCAVASFPPSQLSENRTITKTVLLCHQRVIDYTRVIRM